MFAWLAVRHVGEGPFLEDQVDQIQNFDALFRLRPEGLWGAVMSGTSPPARALGPLGGVVFGVPTALGLDPDGIHLVAALLLAGATAACFLAFLALDAIFAWLWLLMFATTGVVWWNAGMLWSNTLLLPAGLAIAALALRCLQQPSVSRLAWLIVVGLFALQLHLVAIVAVPVFVIVAIMTRRRALHQRATRSQVVLLLLAVLAAIGPYALAETHTSFRNTRAILSHLESADAGADSFETGSATASLVQAMDPTHVLERAGLGTLARIAAGTVLAGTAVVLLLRRSRNESSKPLFWMTVISVAAVAGQALFFLGMQRPFLGYHYFTLLAPFYVVPLAALVRVALPERLTSPAAASVLGMVVFGMLLWMGPTLADRYVERTPWTYSNIRGAVEALCGNAAVETDEGSGFAAQLNPNHDSVLRFLMKRQLVSCRYLPMSNILIAAGREADYRLMRTVGETRYRLELVLPPGIARYRRED